MHTTVIYIDPTRGAASPIGFTQAAGMPGDILFEFKLQNNTPYPNMELNFPQAVLRPFTRTGAYAYDIDVYDPVGGAGIATIPGVVMNDRFHVEVYVRAPNGAPTWMIAYGRIDLTGFGYTSTGPLGPASYPTGPSGPAGLKGETGAQGPQGDPGMRGSRWYTGPGAPSLSVPPGVRVDGDMWLNETNGDVWRWNDAAASWLAFKGV